MDAALASFERWKLVPPEKRAAYLFRAAKVMRRRRFELNAVEILEVGKTWIEADGDVAEAIDFAEFYAREMLRYAKMKTAIQLPGEKNELVYIPLGVGVVIPPWNFPLAMLAGMTLAAVVAGNTVVLKPSSDSCLTGFAFMEIMDEIGLPPGVVNFVSGPGSAVGDTLVKHRSGAAQPGRQRRHAARAGVDRRHPGRAGQCCNPGQAPDQDCDGLQGAAYNCPFFAQAGSTDTDGDGRGDACQCTDQNGDGRNTVSDLVAINAAILDPGLVTPLCDGNGDGLCNVSDIIAANNEIFSPTSTSICGRQPVPGP